MEPTIYRFIWRHSARQQLFVLLLTLASFPVLYGTLELPKRIINRAIAGTGFPKTVAGFELDRIAYLLVLCVTFLALVSLNGFFKFYINVYKGRLGERLLRLMRTELCLRVMRFPTPHFRRTSPGELIPMIIAELEPIGGFIGDAVALPAFQGGTLFTVLVFMFAQDWALGLAAISLYPFQAWIIPRLQRRTNQLNRERVQEIRRFSDRIGETVPTVPALRANGGVPVRLAQASSRLQRIYEIRLSIFRRKYFVKFLNNFINSIVPFFFYSIGGYLVIRGSLSFGSLVAVLAAYKDMSAPWRELLDFYQTKEDSRIRYEQVIERFQPRGLIAAALVLPPEDDEASRLAAEADGNIAFESVSYVDEDGIRRVDGIGIMIRAGEHAALVGSVESGRSEIAMLLGRILTPTAGRIRLGAADLETLPFGVSARRLGYVGPAEMLFAGSLRENLLFSLRRPSPAEATGTAPSSLDDRGFSIDQPHAGTAVWDSVDCRQAGVSDEAGLEHRIMDVLRTLELRDDVYQFGLRGRIDPRVEPEAAERLLQARYRLMTVLEDHCVGHLVERFDPQRYNDYVPVAVNLLFGTSRDWQPEERAVAIAAAELATQPFVVEILRRAGLDADLFRIGVRIAEKSAELFSAFPPEHAVFERFGLVAPDEFRDVKTALAKAHQAPGLDHRDADAWTCLVRLALRLVAGRDPLNLIDQAVRERVLGVRHVIATEMPAELRGRIELFDPDRYNAALTVRRNVLFGALVPGCGVDSAAVVNELSGKAVEGLDDIIVGRVGLAFEVGSGGVRLTAAQRQKVAIAAAVLRRPATALVLDGATAVLDAAAECRIIEALRRELADGRSLVCGLERIDRARSLGFDLIAAIHNGTAQLERRERQTALASSAA